MSPLLDKFTCVLTQHGKKAKAEGILQRALTLLHNDRATAHEMVARGVDNVKPLFELKRVRVAGTTHQITALLTEQRQTSIALRWIVQASRADKQAGKTKRMSFADNLARQLADAAHMKGTAFAKKQTVHKVAEANRAFAHYRW